MFTVFNVVVFIIALIVAHIVYHEMFVNEDQRKLLRDFEERMRKKKEGNLE
jgi:hypothetical protein